MNAIVPATQALVPTSIEQAMRLAEMMASAKLVPRDLQGSAADCLMVIQQAVRWQMDPFAVAQECSVIQGKLMHSGKLVAAVVNSRGNMAERLSFSYKGEGGNREITVSGKIHGETEPRTVTVRLKDAETKAHVWKTQPDQQLMYHGARVWARRHTPELMLGVWSPEEFDEAPPPTNGNGPVIEHEPVRSPLTKAPPKRTRAEISAHKEFKEHTLESVIQDLADIPTLSALEKYEKEVLTPEFMGKLGNVQYHVAERVETRRVELSEPAEVVDEETGEITEAPAVAEPETKAAYIQLCHAAIEAAPSAASILAWWEEEADNRLRYRLSKAEEDALEDRAIERGKELKKKKPALDEMNILAAG